MSDLPVSPPMELHQMSWMQRHVWLYSSVGKTMRNGVLVWSMTGEPLGEGDDRHWSKVAEVMRGLASARKEVSK